MLVFRQFYRTDVIVFREILIIDPEFKIIFIIFFGMHMINKIFVLRHIDIDLYTVGILRSIRIYAVFLFQHKFKTIVFTGYNAINVTFEREFYWFSDLKRNRLIQSIVLDLKLF